VGDTITITFKNKATKPYSIHPHGVKYTKMNEGVYYKYNRHLGSTVQPGQTFVYQVRIAFLYTFTVYSDVTKSCHVAAISGILFIFNNLFHHCDALML
jgi:FtsP/CotA-like multicopper oxidase with cupredoxin domain